jgi:hypothetical protein
VVPVGYGRVKIGSKTISVGLTNVDKERWEGKEMVDLLGRASDNTPPEVVLVGGTMYVDDDDVGVPRW